jgi:hypothetical protein
MKPERPGASPIVGVLFFLLGGPIEALFFCPAAVQKVGSGQKNGDIAVFFCP